MAFSVFRKGLLSSCALLTLAACETPGQSGRDGEWARQRAEKGFLVVSANHERAVVAAKGRQVAIEAADGFCLARESIETTGRSAFALIGDCVLEDPAGTNGKRKVNGRLDVPRGLPGIITVSISGDKGYSRNGGGASLDDLSAFLDTKEGRRMLGRGGGSGAVKIKEKKKVGDALYVLVEDSEAQVIPVLSPQFWRSFTELNGRMTVVTISGFRDRPLGKNEMLDHLVNQVKTLTLANATPVNEPITRIAAADARRQQNPEPNPVQTLADIKPDGIIVTAQNVREEVISPKPAPKAKPEPAAQPAPEIQPAIADAPEAVDPAIQAEIALAAESIPIPSRPIRPGAQKPEPEAEAVVAAADAAAPAELTNPAAKPDADPAPAEVAAAQAEPVPTPAETEKAAVVKAEDSPEPAPTAPSAPAAKPKPAETTVAAEAAPAPEAPPTKNAPTKAPKAPRRPKRG